MYQERNEIESFLHQMSSPLDFEKYDSVAIILAAGHGKRIRSRHSKMLHKIWGIPTVVRVSNAVSQGLSSPNQIIVVGIKAKEVAITAGKRNHRLYVFQERQLGTGHAVKVALEVIKEAGFKGNVYIFPGDMGLLTSEVVHRFQQDFLDSGADMMVLTGHYEGDVEQNSYGRIVRVPPEDRHGNSTGEDEGRVIEIRERKDIDAMDVNQSCIIAFNGREFSFSRQELLEIREFNTGIFAFRSEPLLELIDEIKPENVQNEYYITDMISIFNRRNYQVRSTEAIDNTTVIGFNVKSVLKEMENVARHKVWLQLRDIITIEDAEDFFIAEPVVEELIQMDKREGPLDIVIGKGVHIGPGVKLSKGVEIGNNTYIEGNVILGENVKIHENVHISTYSHQQLKIGENSEILQGDIIKGNLKIGKNTRIESSVNMTGSDDYPMIVGNNVIIKGTSYLFGSVIDDDLFIEHSVLKRKHVERIVRKDGTIQPVQWVMPMPRGLDSVVDLPPRKKGEE